jgi:cytochrome c peroxidase
MFWDSRAEQNPDGTFSTPFGDALPEDMPNVLAVQAMFPVVGRNELRGLRGDRDIFGNVNEIAQIDDDDQQAIWDAVMARVLGIQQYRDQFQLVFPDIPVDELGYEHAAEAIAAFEGDAFTFTGSPWDQYLAGTDQALSDAAKRGALLFYGKANCASCHSGNLLTDQQHHNIAVPQLGPGKGQEAPLDLGRGRIIDKPCLSQAVPCLSQDQSQQFAFRTAPLRNVSLTAPYMHNGAFSTLEAAVRHHLDPEESLRTYDPAQHLPADLQDTVQDDPNVLNQLLSTIAPVTPTETLNDEEYDDLLAFLTALTDPAAENFDTTPDSVPSGLSISEVFATMAVEPKQGMPGATVTITGTSYLPGGYDGTILLDGEEIQTITIPDDGAFTVSYTLPADITSGDHIITVCAGSPCFTDERVQRAGAAITVTGDTNMNRVYIPLVIR